MSERTAHLQLERSAPDTYENDRRCARMIAETLVQMDLDAMARRANGECGRKLLAFSPTNETRIDREVIEVLASAARQLAKIESRCAK